MYYTGKGYAIRINPSKQYIFVYDKIYEEANNRNSIFAISNTPIKSLYPNTHYEKYMIKWNKQLPSENK